MHPDSFRFRPPGFELPAELDWALARAFGPLSGRPFELRQPELALHWASVLALRERIASRLPRADAERELPIEIVDVLWRSRTGLAARTLLLREVTRRAAARAVELGIRLVALKGMALLESGVSAWGSRPLVDVDLLAEADRAAELQAALEASGFGRSGPGERHHLPPLADRSLGELELHRQIPGLAVAGGGSATVADLLSAGVLRPAPGIDGLDLPAPALLAAHALTHALDQHGLSPTAYPVTRLVGDLIDLGEAIDDAPLGELPHEGAAWVRSSVSRRELGAAAALCRALEAGEPTAAGADGLALLRHTAAAFSSPRYRRRLRWRAAWRALRRRQWSKFRHELSRRVR